MCCWERFNLVYEKAGYLTRHLFKCLINWDSDSLKSLLISFVTKQTVWQIDQPLCNHPISPNVQTIKYPFKQSVLWKACGVNNSYPHNEDAASGAGSKVYLHAGGHTNIENTGEWTTDLLITAGTCNHLMDTAFSVVGERLLGNNQVLLYNK